MSLMIMGIGLVSVATLFPLSVLRSIEATQQTTATALRYGAEALIDGSGTEPVYDTTDLDGDSDFAEFKPNWRVSRPNPSPPPPYIYESSLTGCLTAAIALDPDGDHDPRVNDVDYAPSAMTGPLPYAVPVPEHTYYYNPNNHREGFYVVDPLGYWRLRQQGETHPFASIFGDWGDVGGPPKYGPASSPVYWYTNRFSLNIPTNSAYDLYPLFGFTGTPESFTDAPPSNHIEDNARIAEFAVGLPDSFITVADGRVSEGAVTVASDSVDFTTAASDVGTMFAPGGVVDPVMLERGQVTVFTADGRRSIVRKLETVSGGHLQFKTALPANYPPGDIDRVLVEAVEDRYTWMLTVRRKEPASLIDVVVFFRRAFGRDDEHVYLVTQNFANIAAFNQRKLEQKEYFVAWNDATEPEPDFKEGDWMFDPINFRWHKIGQVLGEEEIDPSIWTPDVLNALGFPAGTTYAANKKIVFRLEGAQVADEPVRRGILMDGVVDVYPLEPKSPGN